LITTMTVKDIGYYKGAGAGAGKAGEALPEGATSYYTGAAAHGEPAGRWSGRLAEALGLEGEVSDADMELVFGKFTAPDGTPIGNGLRSFPTYEERVERALAAEPDALPERIEEIRAAAARSGRSTTLGMDLTFSVPKSVTVAHTAVWRAEVDAIGSGDLDRADQFASIREAIEGAIGEANRVGIEEAARLATARVGTHGGGHAGRWVDVEDVAVASFFQHTSRADDPQLHTHNVMLNRALCEDGEIHALDTVDLRKQRHAYSALADRVLAERLSDMGLRMETRPNGMAREIVGIDQEVMDLFSQRRTSIVARLEPAIERAEERLGRPLNDLQRNRLAQAINLETRKGKSEGDIDWDGMLASWEDRIVSDLGQGLSPVAERVRAGVEAGAVGRDGSFSPAAIRAEAVQAVAEQKPAWSRADLVLEVERRLPLLGLSTEDTVDLVNQLADRAIVESGAVQVAGNVGIAPPPGFIVGSYVAPSDRLFAAPMTLDAEDLIRRSAVERGRGPAAGFGEKRLEEWRGRIGAWLDENYTRIGADQREAVLGIASSDAALAQIVGPAGTGKSFAAGALSGAWEAHTDGVVHGMAPSEVAARVLVQDGVLNSDNIDKWIAAQDRLEAGRPLLEDFRRAVGPRDIILVDEASMARTGQLARIRDVADSIGARMVLMGDPRQLGSVGAGGVMDLVGDRAETYMLTEVRRFTEAWEGPASLALREGSEKALAEYDRRGRLIDAATMDEAIEAAARAAAADRLAGRSVAVTADTNEDAARIANRVREHLVAAGVVEAGGVELPRTGGVAGIGDEVMTRQIDHEIGVLNGDRWQVVGWGEDGSLSVVGDDSSMRELPAEYVTEHVQHAYASTVHGSQGKTLDVGYAVTSGRSDAAAQYVALTRGRDRNTMFVALSGFDEDAAAPGVKAGEPRLTARAVLADSLEREATGRAATVEADLDAARLANMKTVLGRLEDAVQRATRSRMEGDLDRLVGDGVLPVEDRARVAADQSSEHLSRVLRAAEQAGLDPEVVLREAAAGRSLDDAESVAQVLLHRITSAHDIAAAAPGRVAPARLPEESAGYVARWQEVADARARELGGQVAEEAPQWAAKAFGPVPQDPGERLEWETRAGAVAGYREATGFTDEARAIGAAPGLSSTEKRAAWWGAWEAMGRPEETRVEAALPDGQLRARVSAWSREQLWAPPHADASLRQAELDADEARREAILARTSGAEEEASRLEAEAEERAAVARGMAEVAASRERWAAETAVTRELAERAAEELSARGLQPGEEDDRVSAEEWLEHQRAAVEDEDEVRPVTELDVPIAEDEEEILTADADEEEPASVEDVVDAEDLDSESDVEEAKEPANTSDVEERDEGELRAEAARTPAHEIAPMEPDDLELAALVKTADDAEDRVRDRESEEAAHDDADDLNAIDGLDTASDDEASDADVAVTVGGGDGEWRKPWDEED
jgi:conjugative relaxase-like TrwC/TraI family protein